MHTMVTAYHDAGGEHRFAYWRCACKELFVTDPPETPRPVPDVVSLLQSLFTPPAEIAESKDEEPHTCPDCGGPAVLETNPETGQAEYVCAGEGADFAPDEPDAPDQLNDPEAGEASTDQPVNPDHTVVLNLHLPARQVYDMLAPLWSAQDTLREVVGVSETAADEVMGLPVEKLVNPVTGKACTRFKLWYSHAYSIVNARTNLDALYKLNAALRKTLNLSSMNADHMQQSNRAKRLKRPTKEAFRAYITDAIELFVKSVRVAIMCKETEIRRKRFEEAANTLGETLGLQHQLDAKRRIIWCPKAAGMFIPMYRTDDLAHGLLEDQGWLKWIRQQAR